MYKFISAILVLYIVAVLGDFPDGITRCQSGDNDCFRKSAQEVFKNHAGGLRELNLAPFDPLHVKSLILARNPSSPINLAVKFKDLNAMGLKNAHVTLAKGFTFGERSIFEFKVPEFILKGKYVIDGSVLFLPITGTGVTTITSKNVNIKYTFDLKPVERNGEVFSEIEHVKLELKPELIHYNFENLFNGDKSLGDTMNKLLNENWRDIYNEMEGGIEKGLSVVVKQVINNVLRKFPYDVLYPKTV